MDISPTRIDDGPNNQPLLGMVQKPPGGQIDVPLRLGGSLLIVKLHDHGKELMTWTLIACLPLAFRPITTGLTPYCATLSHRKMAVAWTDCIRFLQWHRSLPDPAAPHSCCCFRFLHGGFCLGSCDCDRWSLRTSLQRSQRAKIRSFSWFSLLAGKRLRLCGLGAEFKPFCDPFCNSCFISEIAEDSFDPV